MRALMQKAKLPLTLAPIRAAQQRLDYTGYYSASQAVRLVESVASVDSDIDVVLSCHVDPQGLTVLVGKAVVEVSLCCQQCNETFDTTLSVDYRVSPVRDNVQIERLPECYEPVELDEFNEISLLNLIEDELILTLPIIPLHNNSRCETSGVTFVYGEVPEEEKPNLFSALAALKKK